MSSKLHPRAGRTRLARLGTLLLAGVVACDGGGEPAAPALGEQEFEDVMVELRLAEREAAATDSPRVEFERRKQEVLERHGTSEEEIREFAREAARDLERLTAIWDRISARLRRPAGPDEAL